MKPIDIFPWDDHFKVGIPLIDQQHYRLVELLNQLAREVVFEAQFSHLGEIFNALLDYTIYHFQTEETIWEKYFPNDVLQTQHKQVHQNFIDTIKRLKEEQNSRSTMEIAQETLGFLARWLASHILETDRFMAYIVLSLQAGMDMDAAKEQADINMSGFTRTLIDLILTIYEKLSDNTLQLMYEVRNYKELEGSSIETDNLLHSIIETSPVRIFWKDKDLNYLGCNLVFAKDAGEKDSHSIIGKNDFELCWKDQAELYRADDRQVLETGISKLFFEEPQTSADGSIIWLSTSKVPLRDKHNNIIGIVGLYEEITTRKNAEIALKSSQQHLQAIIDNEPECVKLISPEGRLLDMNPAGLAMLEVDSLEEAQSHTLIDYVVKEWRAPFTNLLKRVMTGENARLEFEIIGLKGTHRWLETNATPLRDSEGNITMLLGITRDITERKRNEEQIRYLANFDLLTGLPNRAQLDFRVEELLSFSTHHNSEVAVMFLDLDHFKDINDSLGHNIGDRLLIEVSKKLQSVLRAEDIIARFGGDEFLFLLPNITNLSASQIAQKLLHVITDTFSLDEHQLKISGSIGISLFPADGSNFETLYKNADTAMYRAKQDGRNNFCFFTEDMQKNSIRMLELSNALHYALERNQLELYYQPQFSTEDESIVGAEALLRWSHPELGNIPPAEFIPIAEENGIILSIGQWVLKTAIGQAKKWLDQGMEPIIMAVNLSAVQFRSANLSAEISNILNEVGLAPEYLEIELTESVAMYDPKKAIAIMKELHDKGIRMSIDDFGTGYSSLSYLKKFQIYKLKIDQSFIRDISIDSEDKAIVGAVISMSKSLGFQTIAEGVETISQLKYLREQGCDEIQGYYYSKPLPVAAFEAFRNLHVSKHKEED